MKIYTPEEGDGEEEEEERRRKKEQNKEKEEQSPFELANFKAGSGRGCSLFKRNG